MSLEYRITLYFQCRQKFAIIVKVFRSVTEGSHRSHPKFLQFSISVWVDTTTTQALCVFTEIDGSQSRKSTSERDMTLCGIILQLRKEHRTAYPLDKFDDLVARQKIVKSRKAADNIYRSLNR